MIFTNDSGGCTFSHCYRTVETGGHFTRYDCLGKTSQKEVTIPSVLYLHVVVCKRALLLWGERPPHHGLCATKGSGQTYTIDWLTAAAWYVVYLVKVYIVIPLLKDQRHFLCNRYYLVPILQHLQFGWLVLAWILKKWKKLKATLPADATFCWMYIFSTAIEIYNMMINEKKFI